MDLIKARELREQRAKLVGDAQAIFDKETRTAEDNAKFDKMMADADALKVDIDRMERVEAAVAETRATGKPPAAQIGATGDDVAAIQEYRAAEHRHGIKAMEAVRPEVRRVVERTNAQYWEATKAYLIGGDANLSPEARAILRGDVETYRMLGCRSVAQPRESRAMAEGVGGNALQGTGGGYFVPVGFVDEVEQALLYYGDILNTSTIMNTATGNPLPYPNSNDTGTMGVRLAENTQVVEGDLTLGSIVFGAWKYSTKMIQLSVELLQDSAFNLEEFIKEQFAIRLGRILNSDMTLGTGSTASMPNGILNAATAGPIATGSSTNDGGTETGGLTIGSDDLVNLEHSVDLAYRRGARYSANDSTILQLKKLKDKYGRPLWLPGIAVNAPDTINGYPYSTNNNLPVIALSAKTMLFGQHKKYVVRRVKELAVLRLNERFADYGQVAFLGFARYDGNLLDAGTHPVKYLTQAAA